MAKKLRIQNSQTGQIIEIDEAESARYGITPAATPQQTQTEGKKYITNYSPEEHLQALNKARAAGDKVKIKEIEDDFAREIAYQKEIAPSAETSKKGDSLSAINNFINTLESRYQKSGAANTNLGPISRVAGAVNQAGAALGYNPEAQTYLK